MATISFGADERTVVTDHILNELRARGFDVVLHGTMAGEEAQWAEVGAAVARDVVEGRAETGIACCFTGTGVSMAANKVPGARAALCFHPDIAHGARKWNDANVLCMALSRTTPEEATAILEAWLAPATVDESELPNIAALEGLSS